MSYSVIDIKPCKCGCGKRQTFNCGGYFYDHMPEEMKLAKGTKRELQRKNSNARKAISVKLRSIERKESVPNNNLELYFKLAATELAKMPYCMECGEFIPSWAYRSATAHILPKRKEFGFPSVASNPLNRLFLCGINGCHDKTHTWATFETMKVWPLAVESFKKIYPYINKVELKNIPGLLLKYIQ